MSDTINIPVELLREIVDVNVRQIDIINRLQACETRNSVSDGAAEVSQKEGRDNPKPPSLKTKSYNKYCKQYDNL